MSLHSRWSTEEAGRWYAAQPWPVGCNFTPSTAINQLEMWQADTFDPGTIDRELGWAASIGFNTVRVYLHDLLWDAEPSGFRDRIDRYLEIAGRHGIRTIFVLFDDCWNPNPRLGKQPDPLPGVHNSGWVQGPGHDVVLDTAGWPRLERYVKEIIGAFGGDERILMWDLYNEPGNQGLGNASLPLLGRAFEWAQAATPSQPLTCGVWFDNPAITELQITASDVITFHNYQDAADLERQIAVLKTYGRPLVCTEYMARQRNSRFETHLPIFRRERVGCINWGLVSGKTQTIYPWRSPGGEPEPTTWFHDIFRPDGTPYDPKEIAAIREATRR
jgi:hypothetical protein